MLGLREDFGGDPQHLDRLTVVQPGRDGTRRYLVLHDIVPGGTGYLDRIGDPGRMKAILEHAQRVLRDCPCALDGLDACHRCLLGVVGSVEAGVVRRATALALVTEILANWEVAPTETVTRADMSRLAGSELEQRFRALLLSWAGGRATTYGDEARLNLGSGVSWRVREQVPIGAACPDYLFTPTGSPAPEVAVFLDGLTYHATPERNNTASDAAQRAALREAGYVVWNLTWADLDGFERFLQRGTDDSRLLPQTVENMVRQLLPAGMTGTEMPFRNPALFLTRYLSDPGSVIWPAVASAMAQAMLVPAASALRGSAASVTRDVALAGITALHQGTSGSPLADVPGGTFRLAVRASQGGCWMAAAADMPRRTSTVSAVVILDDRPGRVADPGHQQRWADWLHWANVLQFLRGEQRAAHFVTTTTEWDPSSVLPPAVVPAAVPAVAAVPSSGLPSSWSRLLRVAGSPAAESLIAALGRDGRVPVPDIGLDVGDDNAWCVELAWQDGDRKLVVLIDTDEQRDAWLSRQGWHKVSATDDDAFDQIVAYLLEADRLGGNP